MLKRIYQLLPEADRRKSVWIALSVLVRAVLDFAGLAALLPVLILVLGDKPDKGYALLLCAAALLFLLLKNGLAVWLARYQSTFLLNLYKQFSYRMFCNYYRRGLPFMKSKSSVQLGHEVNFICYAFSLNVLSPILRMGGEALLLALMVLALVVWAPVAGLLLCAGFLPMVLFYVRVVKKRLRRYGLAELEARRLQARTVVEAFRGYTELEINQAFHTSLRSFTSGLDVINNCRLKTETTQMLPAFFSEAAIVVGLALLLSLGDGNLKIISGVFAIAAFRMIPAVRSILSSWGTLQNSSHCIDTVADGINDEEAQTSADEVESIPFLHQLTADHITFAFPDGHTVLSDFSCCIRKGERVGIRGVSGSGKSTLFNILLGFFRPQTGVVRIDDTTLSPQTVKAWHKLVGYVPQEIFIIQGSLADNIALGRPTVDEAKISRVLEQVQLKEWAESLPDGIHTSLGEYGSRLSGGQKQRIGIARALYKDAEILFFDEATSALDNETEKEINLALQNLSDTHKELTLIVIAHRESSLQFCDRIIDLSSK